MTRERTPSGEEAELRRSRLKHDHGTGIGMKPLILSLLDKRHRLYMPRAPQRVALALTKYAASVSTDLTICVYDVLRGIASRVISKGITKNCQECNNENNYALLWCQGKCTEKLILAAGTIIRNYKSCGLEKVDIKKASKDIYLLLIHLGNNILREYIRVDNNYDIMKAPSPCKDVEALKVLKKYFGTSEILLREVIETLSMELGIKKAKAREIVASLSEKGCIHVDTKNKKVWIHEL